MLKRALSALLCLSLGGQTAFAGIVTGVARLPASGPTSSPAVVLNLSGLAPGALLAPAAFGPASLGNSPLFLPQPLSSIRTDPSRAIVPAAALGSPSSARGVSASFAGAAMKTPAQAAAPGQSAPAPEKDPVGRRLSSIESEVRKAGESLASESGEDAHSAADLGFRALTGEKGIDAAAEVPVPAGPAHGSPRLQAPGTDPSGDTAAAQTPEDVPAPRASLAGSLRARLRVFADDERNRSFWRYLAGYATYLVGGLPFLISSFTRNTLRENGDLRAANAEALQALVRENRSLARIAHWTSQAVSYVCVPLFARDAEAGPRKWLLRSSFIRVGLLSLIPAVFFASGIFSVQAAAWTLFGIIAVHSFFLGIFATMEAGTTTKIIGDKSVTPAERMKANALLTLVAAAIAVVAPAFAGPLAHIGNLFGKEGVGGAVIFGIYALTVGIAGLIFAGIGIIGRKAMARQETAGRETAPAEAAKPHIVKDLWSALQDGTRLILKSRFLRTMLLLNLVVSLFSDPLIFNVLPEFVEGLLKANPAAVDGLLGVPVLGWFVKSLSTTPMGYFGLLVAAGSFGSILASLLLKPLRRLFLRLGFKTEESLTIPFYLLAALEVPAFWAMTLLPGVWSVLGLYAFQLFAVSFASMIIMGIHQKTLGAYSASDLNKVLAAESFLTILAAIASTWFYGFVLTDISIRTALLIAAGATTVMGALHAAAPWMFFTKEQRRGTKASRSDLIDA